MGSLSSSDSNNWGMVTNQNTSWDSAGSCKDGEADKGLKLELIRVLFSNFMGTQVFIFVSKCHFDPNFSHITITNIQITFEICLILYLHVVLLIVFLID